jgi:GT2 family glycosyltransferase
VPSLRRFDLDQTTPLSDEEINRRWANFHQVVRTRSGSRMKRVIGPLLGENTTRYRVARSLARPFMSRRRRPSPDASAATTSSRQARFPCDYDPAAPLVVSHLMVSLVASNDVLVLVVNENETSAETLVETLNQSLEATAAQWLFLIDSSRDGEDRDLALQFLLTQATDSSDVVFADEGGPNPYAPILKPAAVGPHTLLSYNVVGRPALIRIDSLKRIGGFKNGFGWAFEHDAYLRLSESGARFRHVAKVLHAGRPDIAFDPPHLDPGTISATKGALLRRGWVGTVERGAVAGVARWNLAPPSPLPSIDIVIPTRDRIELVKRCIESIEVRSTYPNFDIIILDNDSVDPASHDYFATTKYRVVKCPGPFNYARIVNRGVEHSVADFIVTLNNDTVVLSEDWLERMVSLASLEDVGVVGACLLDPSGRHEHDGFVIAPYPQHLRIGLNYPDVNQLTGSVRDVSAVTGAAQMVRRSFWQQLHGMDEHLKVVMNDVDLCLRSQLEGHLVVYTPDVELIHEAGSSRGDLDPIEDRNLFVRRWDIFGTFQDPYFPESLELIGDTFRYRSD